MIVKGKGKEQRGMKKTMRDGYANNTPFFMLISVEQLVSAQQQNLLAFITRTSAIKTYCTKPLPGTAQSGKRVGQVPFCVANQRKPHLMYHVSNQEHCYLEFCLKNINQSSKSQVDGLSSSIMAGLTKFHIKESKKKEKKQRKGLVHYRAGSHTCNLFL